MTRLAYGCKPCMTTEYLGNSRPYNGGKRAEMPDERQYPTPLGESNHGFF